MPRMAKLEAAVARAFTTVAKDQPPSVLDLIASTRVILNDSAHTTESIVAAILRHAATKGVQFSDE
jgi:hypothetical protein